MTAADREQILKNNHQLAKQALRVLGYAYRPLTDAESQSADPAAVEQSLIFIGLSGMIDPPRPEVKAAIQEAKEAGIRSLMITGDHKITARAIAERLGIKSGSSRLGRHMIK